MARVPVIQDKFNGGISSSSKEGIAGSYKFGRNIDIHSDPSKITLLPKTVKDSGATVDALVIDAVRVKNGDTYFLGTNKKLFRRTAAGSWSVIDTVSGDTNGMGLFYWQATDTIYITTDQSVTTYGPVTGTPAFTDNKYDTVTDQLVTVSGSGAAYPQNANIQGHWKFNNNLSDDSGNGNTLTNNNTATFSTTAKEGSHSVDLERTSSQYLNITDASQTGLDFTSDFTVACWVRIENAPGTDEEYNIVNKRDGSNNNSYNFAYRDSSGTKQFVFTVDDDGTGSDTTVTVTQTLTAGTDYYVAVVYDASAGEAAFYVDGSQSGSTQTGLKTSIFNGTANFTVGGRHDGTADYFDGLIDDLIVWDKELTSAEITNAMNAATSTYALGTAISENNEDRFTFTPAVDPQEAIVVNVDTVGTGDWTVTVHDDDDNTIASATIVNGSMSTGDVTFTFSTNWRPVLGATYHLHITDTTGDGEVTGGASVKTKAARLVDPVSNVHPMIEFLDFLVIANERYLSIFDGNLIAAVDDDGTLTSSWDAHRITLPSGYEVQCLARFDEFIVAGAEYRGDNDEDFSSGLIVLWDGTSDTFNSIIEIQEGGVQAFLPVKNFLYFIGGLRGELFAFDGETYQKVKRFPKTSNKEYVRTLFSSTTIYQGIPMFGLANSTDSSTFEQGVYGYGSVESVYPDVLSYDHTVSSGTRGATTLKIGAVKAFGTDLFIGWDDNGTYGVDIVEPTNDPYANGTLETLIFDDRRPHKRKKLLGVKANHSALASGESMQVGYAIDRGSFTTKTANSTSGATETVFDVDKLFKEKEMQATLAATGSTSPELYTLTADVDNRRESDKNLKDA